MSTSIAVAAGLVTCTKCRYDLRGLRQGAECPECGTPVMDSLGAVQRTTCIKCAYSLAGLPDTGDCPECGTPVGYSRYGVLLRFSGHRHLRRLHTGVVIVQAGILMQVALLVVIFLAGAFPDAASPFVTLIGLIPFAMLLLSLVVMAGWWRFTAQDPRSLERDTASRSRGVVRAMVVVQATAVLLPMLLGFISALVASGGMWLMTVGAVLLGYALSLVAFVVLFFASMAYLKWLAVRLPSEAIIRRAGLVIWLAPVLATVGLLVVIGPLIAVAFYWNLLDSVRKHLKQVRAEVGGSPVAAAAA